MATCCCSIQAVQVIQASAADVNSMLTEALVISATVLFVFVIICIVAGTVWVLRKNSRHHSGEAGGSGGRMRPIVMQTSALGGLATPPDGNSGRTVETPRTPGGRRRAALFLHGLPTPRTTDEMEATAYGDVEVELSQSSGDQPSHNGNAAVIHASPFGFGPPQCSSAELAAAEFEVPSPEHSRSTGLRR